jgi:hypothetical protein
MDGPYKPKYKGFDEAATQNAQATADRARESAGAQGHDANREYVDDGPDEAALRTGRDKEDLGRAIEGARKKRPER